MTAKQCLTISRSAGMLPVNLTALSLDTRYMLQVSSSVIIINHFNFTNVNNPKIVQNRNVKLCKIIICPKTLSGTISRYLVYNYSIL